jgi:hypothetical protein
MVRCPLHRFCLVLRWLCRHRHVADCLIMGSWPTLVHFGFKFRVNRHWSHPAQSPPAPDLARDSRTHYSVNKLLLAVASTVVLGFGPRRDPWQYLSSFQDHFFFFCLHSVPRSYFTTGSLPPISLSWRQAPWRSWPEILVFQLSPCGNSPSAHLCELVRNNRLVGDRLENADLSSTSTAVGVFVAGDKSVL